MVDEKHQWYHTIDLPDGSVTPGYFDTRTVPDRVEWPSGLHGGRCLDVGTFDGFWAFEMEQRGAGEVIALDIPRIEDMDWFYDNQIRGPEVLRSWGADRGPGFQRAHDALDSKVSSLKCSVYDLDPEKHGTFDVVFCGALLLHLRDPVRALEAMRAVCSGTLVLVETLDPRMELRSRGIPAARFRPNWDEWWCANAGGLVAFVDAAGFSITWKSELFLVPPGPGHVGPLPSRLHGVVTRQPLTRGVVHAALTATPRDRRPAR